ncbi:MAG: hypothetical protein Q8K75_12965 [Chlamydiales bacterium]|nr:hypothetical protein [Chlamydiales bacterium]
MNVINNHDNNRIHNMVGDFVNTTIPRTAISVAGTVAIEALANRPLSWVCNSGIASAVLSLKVQGACLFGDIIGLCISNTGWSEQKKRAMVGLFVGFTLAIGLSTMSPLQYSIANEIALIGITTLPKIMGLVMSHAYYEHRPHFAGTVLITSVVGAVLTEFALNSLQYTVRPQ